ncbi:E3 ubiquitin-protein ligase TRIM38-like [Sorex fumeus]|uniref:E3 ubiquitin-protein ligase TRIM38-like n=1 Tax=Sorex fumeus TaxID=62283 RepID=UPI0024AE3D08|nr:E3 ubiquitin-protein ligase TRIM38-like [Sorex fumeus]XP_055988447.1 E3 ubiquitin-protein ligase TRIM38-like [Sorex fumeus]
MASVIKKLREEATCSNCQQLMTDPVVLDCGHSFCHACLMGINENQQGDQPAEGIAFCALCMQTFQIESLRPNKKLKSIIETIKNVNCEKLCEEHGEKLHLFCEDDDQLICLCCERKPQHKGHVLVLAEDVCEDYKEKLQKAVTKLREDESLCNNLKLFLRNQRTEWEEKVKLQRQKIQSEFENLRRFLRKEETYFLRRLKQEEQQTVRKLQEGEDKVEKQSQELKNQILELERKCQDTVQNLMEGVKLTLSRSFDVKLELPEAISLDLHTECNVSELYFDVRKVLKRYQVSVTLDPETAHSDLLLSEDGTKVTGGYPQQKPHSASRFTALTAVLGREGFTSGRHYFEVDVGEESKLCAFGVCLADVPRDFPVKLHPECGFWAIRQCTDRGLQALTWPRTSLHQEYLSVVGVFVDYEAGLVSFYNVETGSHIFTFPKASFFHTLLPLFLVSPSSSLTMFGNKQNPLYQLSRVEDL